MRNAGSRSGMSRLRERSRKGLPCTQLYRQMFNRDLYLLAYGNIYSNQGAMTPGATRKPLTDVRGQDRPDHRADAAGDGTGSPGPPVFPKKNGKLRPLGMPSWSDKLVGEVVRLLLRGVL